MTTHKTQRHIQRHTYNNHETHSETYKDIENEEGDWELELNGVYMDYRNGTKLPVLSESFDEFSRSLSNDGEDLILRDAYGNSIDQVIYNDVLPWPEEADGEGSFLKLVGLDLDNNLASSWIARTDTSENLSIGNNSYDSFVSLYPNPVSDILKIKTMSSNILSVKLYSINGKLFRTYSFENRQVELDLSAFENGFYLLQIQTDNELLFKKIIKN